MPIYEYRCQDCGKEFEYMQRMSEDPKSECEACSGRLERLISRSSFHLKGGGWYKDLYASQKKTSGSSDAASSSDTKSDAGSSSESTSSSKESKKSESSTTTTTSSSSGTSD